MFDINIAKKHSVMYHVVGGYPDLGSSQNRIRQLIEAGAEYLEIQIPFSDPVADGPVILNANTQALANGTTPEDCIQLAQKSKAISDTKILFMTYYNIVLQYGLAEFFAGAREAGIYGVIVPDIPYDMDSHEGFYGAATDHDIQVVPVISTITPKDRLVKMADKNPELVYCVSHFGTTGTQSNFDQLEEYLSRVRAVLTDSKLAVGFGIQSEEDVERVISAGADTAVIGSALL